MLNVVLGGIINKLITSHFKKILMNCIGRYDIISTLRANRFEGGSKMKHKVKVTVIDKKLYPELQQQYCHDPNSGACPCYNVGDEFVFYRDDERDDFWHMGLNTLVKTDADPNTVAGGPKLPFCSEAWDAIARYIYTGLQGGSIMKDWMKEENTMITCCSDGTRPVIFKIERIDYE